MQDCLVLCRSQSVGISCAKGFVFFSLKREEDSLFSERPKVALDKLKSQTSRGVLFCQLGVRRNGQSSSSSVFSDRPGWKSSLSFTTNVSAKKLLLFID